MSEKAKHIELVDAVIENFPPGKQWRYCAKYQKFLHISNLKLDFYSCWKCKEHVLEGGVCDPL